MAQVTIEGSPEQIAAAMGIETSPAPRRKKDLSRQRQQAITAKRKIVRQAFDLVRHDIACVDAAVILVGALGGRYVLDQTVLDLAHRIIKDRAGK